MFLWFLLFAVLCYVADRLYNKRRWDMLARIPGFKPHPFIGNMTEIFGTSKPEDMSLVAYFFEQDFGATILFQKEKMYIVWLARKPFVFLTAPETIEPILSSSKTTEKGSFYKFMKTWLGKGLLLSSGDTWRYHRKLLTPSFHFRILDTFIPIMNEQAAILVEKIRNSSASREWIDPFTFYSKCTLDIMCETSMGIKIDAQEADSTYTEMIHNVSYCVSERFSKPWLNWDRIYHLTSKGKTFKKSVKYLHSMTEKVINEKLSERHNDFTPTGSEEFGAGTKKRLAFLDLLLESGLSKQEMREQVDTFMFAGHDTTATALSWMSYLLGLYPDVQEKLINEIDSVFGDDKNRHVTQEDLKNIKYMDMVIKESQRVYPSVPYVSRNLDKDTEVGGYVVPKGTECFIAIYAVHHHPDHYPNPEIFDPERFSTENSLGRHPYAYIPFSAGPRNCIGQRFALMEQKIIACHIFRHFRIHSLDQRDKIIMVPELVLRNEKSIRTNFIPRS